ncbi:MAG: outer membrane protein assembly factor BamB family protein [Halobacteriota archaeon]
MYGTRGGNLCKFDVIKGTKLWEFQAGDVVRSTPAVSDGVVYFGSDDYKVYAIDVETKALRWPQPFSTQFWVRSSPVVADGVVYIGSNDLNVYAIDAATGAKVWAFRIASVNGTVTGSLAVADNLVYVIDDADTFYALDTKDVTNGVPEVEWSRNFYSASGVVNTPVVAGGVVYTVSYDGTISALNAATGAEIGKIEIDNTPAWSVAPAVNSGIVYVADGQGTMYAVDPVTKSRIWKKQLLSPHNQQQVLTSVAYANGVVYVYAYTFETGCRIYACDAAASGNPLWDHYLVQDGIGYAYSSSGSPVAYGLVYAATDKLQPVGTIASEKTTLTMTDCNCTLTFDFQSFRPHSKFTVTGQLSANGVDLDGETIKLQSRYGAMPMRDTGLKARTQNGGKYEITSVWYGPIILMKTAKVWYRVEYDGKLNQYDLCESPEQQPTVHFAPLRLPNPRPIQ